jgi:hypothetical protein
VDPFTPRLAWVSGITCFPYTPDRLWIEPGIRVLASTKNPVGLKVCTETPSTRFSDRPSHALCVPGGRFVSSGLVAMPVTGAPVDASTGPGGAAQWRHLPPISRILEAHGRPQGRDHELIALGDPRLETRCSTRIGMMFGVLSGIDIDWAGCKEVGSEKAASPRAARKAPAGVCRIACRPSVAEATRSSG